MGTDIHIHLEYYTETPSRARLPKAMAPQRSEPRSVIANRFYVPRDYDLFTALAGVRNSANRPVRFSPRGLPKDVSWHIFRQYYVEVLPDDTPIETLQAGWRWCRPEEAQRRAESTKGAIVEIDSRRFIPDDDLHTPSFLYRAEIAQALEFSGLDEASLSREFRLVLGAMRFIDKEFGDRCSRIVFWFDS